jgi:signal transduction histidine kinase
VFSITMPDVLALRHAVGGRHFLQRRPLLLLVPTSLITSLLSREISDGRSLIGWTSANIVAFVACWAWVALADRTVFEDRSLRPVAVTAVVAFGASLGALKGVVTDLAGDVLGLAAAVPGATSWRALGNAVIGAIAVPTVAALQVALDRYRDEHELLVAHQLRTLAIGRPQGLGPQRRAALDAFVEDARRDLASAAPTATEMASTIVRLVDERLRPYTHALWVQRDTAPATIDAATVLRAAVARNPLPPVGIAAPYALIIWPVSVELVGWVSGTLRATIAGASVLLVVQVARSIRPIGGAGWRAVLHLLATVLIASAVQIWQWDHLFGGMPRASTPGLWSSVTILIAAVVVATGAAADALRTRAAVRAEVLRLVGPEALRRIARQGHDRVEAQRVATLLHAELQGHMIAAANRIERLGTDPVAIEEERRALDRLLGTIADLRQDHDARPLVQRIDRLAARWRGFLAIEVDLETDTDVRGGSPMSTQAESVAHQIVQVVSEALVNAVRHGLAQHVAVTVRGGVGHGHVVMVVDDGIGPRDGRPGLGSTYFAAVSAGEWSLDAGSDGGSVLRVRLPG